MPPPTAAKGLLGHFLCGADLPAVCQHISPPPVQFLKFLSLQVISAAGDGVRGSQSGAGGCRSLQDGRGGERGSGGRAGGVGEARKRGAVDRS